MTEIASTCGKQVLLRGVNFAQARDEAAARTIALFINYGVLPCRAPPVGVAEALEVLRDR